MPEVQSVSRGEGKCLVVLHAFPLHHDMWRGLQMEGYRILAADFPGFGVSPFFPEVNLSQAAQGLHHHLTQLGIKQPILLAGISMGGYWALEFIRQYPKQVDKLALISTRCALDRPEQKNKRMETAQRVAQEGLEWYVEGMVKTLLGSTSLQNRPDLVDWMTQTIREADPRSVAAAQLAMADRRDQTEFLDRWEGMSRWFVGLEDPGLNLAEIESQAAKTKSLVVRFAHSGHLIPLESPKAFQTALKEFLTSHK